jgi:hypothetical protein
MRVYLSVNQSLMPPSCRSRSSIVASGRTSAYGTSDAARVPRGIAPHASNSNASAAVKGLLTLASAKGVAGVTFRPLLLSATPLTAVAVLPSSQRIATESPGYRVRRFSRHVLIRSWSRSASAGFKGWGAGRGTGRAAQARHPLFAAAVDAGDTPTDNVIAMKRRIEMRFRVMRARLPNA